MNGPSAELSSILNFVRRVAGGGGGGRSGGGSSGGSGFAHALVENELGFRWSEPMLHLSPSSVGPAIVCASLNPAHDVYWRDDQTQL